MLMLNFKLNGKKTIKLRKKALLKDKKKYLNIKTHYFLYSLIKKIKIKILLVNFGVNGAKKSSSKLTMLKNAK